MWVKPEKMQKIAGEVERLARLEYCQGVERDLTKHCRVGAGLDPREKLDNIATYLSTITAEEVAGDPILREAFNAAVQHLVDIVDGKAAKYQGIYTDVLELAKHLNELVRANIGKVWALERTTPPSEPTPGPAPV